jgi:ferritin-like metal-binding protein YciE
MANNNLKQSGKNQSGKNYATNAYGVAEQLKLKSSTNSTSNQHKTLKDLFHDGLKDIYSAEKQLIEALPKLAKAAFNAELRDAFNDHLEQTKKQAQRLEKIMQHLGIELGSEKCEAMEGMIEEANEVMQNYPESLVRDCALIIGAQKVEHYEIATYGSLCELADVMGMSKIHDTLGRSLDEEEDTDMLLSEIAKDINDEAYEMEDLEEEDVDMYSSNSQSKY